MPMDMTITGMHGFKAARGLDRDKINLVGRGQAARTAFKALDAIAQKDRPEELVLGVATLFAMVCYRCGLQPSELYEKGVRVIDAPFDGDVEADTHVQVLRDLLGAQVMGQEVTIG